MGVLICCEECSSNLGTKFCFELCCLIVGEMFFPVHPAERFVLNGKVKEMLTTVCFAIDERCEMVIEKVRI